jgi:hypothetical protein
VHLLRGESALGALPDSEVQELLRAGWLKPDDLFWFAGMTAWEPLANWDAILSAHQKDSAQAFGRALGAAGGAVAKQAGGFARKLLGLAQERQESVAAIANKLLEASLPQIRKVLAASHASDALANARTAIHDEGLMRKTFQAAYDCLPRPVCRFVTGEQFVRFCLEHRQRVLGLAPTASTDEKEKARHEGGP